MDLETIVCAQGVMIEKLLKRMARLEANVASMKHPQESNERTVNYETNQGQYSPSRGV